MTAAEIERRLLRDRYRRHLVMPRYTPIHWFECDVFELTSAGYFREYEIKVSRRDFDQDVEKYRTDWNGVEQIRTVKHRALASGSTQGPTRFWWVVPEGLIGVGDVPPWSGLIVVSDRMRLIELRSAPQLHKAKANPKIEPHVRGIAYWRLLNLMIFKRLETDEKK